MNKDDIISLFNTKLKEFVNDLLLLYPEDGNLHAAKSAILLLKTIDGKKTLILFKTHIYDKYKNELYAKDESFFLKQTYEEETRLLENIADNITQQLVENIKHHWTSMSESNKEIVWKYWLILLKLCEKYFI